MWCVNNVTSFIKKVINNNPSVFLKNRDKKGTSFVNNKSAIVGVQTHALIKLYLGVLNIDVISCDFS